MTKKELAALVPKASVAPKDALVPKATDVVAIPILNDARTQCTIGEETISVNDTTEYKASAEWRVSVGKVLEFKNPGYRQEDKESVWMRIQDAKDEVQEWISVPVWYEQKQKGLFTSVIKKDNDSKEPPPVRERAF